MMPGSMEMTNYSSSFLGKLAQLRQAQPDCDFWGSWVRPRELCVHHQVCAKRGAWSWGQEFVLALEDCSSASKLDEESLQQLPKPKANQP